MCGLAGFWGFSELRNRHELISRMNHKLVHRGPDSSGVWFETDQSIFLGHQRLSIVDLSDSGSQPMMSESQRYVLAFNGEIYNHRLLKAELDLVNSKVRWRGHSDTEIFLALIDIYGLPTALEKSVGMYAFALYCRDSRRLILGRDRIGEKPIYYYQDSRGIVFASEIEAFQNFPNIDTSLCLQALNSYFLRSYIPAPLSIYSKIRKVEPATYVSFDSHLCSPTSCSYWTIDSSSIHTQSPDSLENATSVLLQKLRLSVSAQMAADVDVGVFLSGGVDSSIIAALMQEHSSKPVDSFSIGFSNKSYDESFYANAVASYLGTNHHKFIYDETDLLSSIYQLPLVYGEPFADSSQLPTLLLCSKARNTVKVALSGDGADELFCGYNHYGRLQKLYNRLSSLVGIKSFSSATHHILVNFLLSSPKSRSLRSIERLLRSAQCNTSTRFYESFTSLWSGNAPLARDYSIHHFSSLEALSYNENCSLLNPLQSMAHSDIRIYLPDDILTKVDRASMSYGLEVRVPMLDHRIVEYSQSLPLHFKHYKSDQKVILKNLLLKYLPPALVHRPKRGFSVPLDSWLCGPLREWTYSILDPNRISSHGIMDHKRVSAYLHAYQSGALHLKSEIWNALLFQLWCDSSFT